MISTWSDLQWDDVITFGLFAGITVLIAWLVLLHWADQNSRKYESFFCEAEVMLDFFNYSKPAFLKHHPEYRVEAYDETVKEVIETFGPFPEGDDPKVYTGPLLFSEISERSDP